ncbi:MAG TPA: SDR family NAD(P)-dependent oxidoreductase [Candidatus Deferrimicrobium sp.]|nr:SDR family NAD(P)-dependent oxidoreductase [Candidatus Deferrimicrobium sp.]
MKLSGNTVLITGGASGIGLALAERFLKAGNKVIVCGRREYKLEEAKEKFPQLHTRVCDVSVESERQLLFDWVKSQRFSQQRRYSAASESIGDLTGMDLLSSRDSGEP